MHSNRSGRIASQFRIVHTLCCLYFQLQVLLRSITKGLRALWSEQAGSILDVITQQGIRPTGQKSGEPDHTEPVTKQECMNIAKYNENRSITLYID